MSDAGFIVYASASIESAKLYNALCRKMRTWALTQKGAAERFGITKKEVSDILHAKFSSWDPERFREVSCFLGLIVS